MSLETICWRAGIKGKKLISHSFLSCITWLLQEALGGARTLIGAVRWNQVPKTAVAALSSPPGVLSPNNSLPRKQAKWLSPGDRGSQEDQG